jgi:hypothetical protein
MDIKTTDSSLDEIMVIIKKNTKELLQEGHSNSSLVQAATSKGLQVLKGSISKQLYVDLCSIALTLYLQNKDV